jgi:hypothetical protein
VTLKLIPKEEYVRREEPKGPMIWGDLAPYTAVAGDMAGKEISGRKAHRDFLRRNGFQEAGNEKEYFTKYGGKSPNNYWVKNK